MLLTGMETNQSCGNFLYTWRLLTCIFTKGINQNVGWKLKRNVVWLEIQSLCGNSECTEPANIQMWSRGREYTQVHVPVYGWMQTCKVEKGRRDIRICFFHRLQKNMWKKTCILYKTTVTESGACTLGQAESFQLLCYCLLNRLLLTINFKLTWYCKTNIYGHRPLPKEISCPFPCLFAQILTLNAWSCHKGRPNRLKCNLQ